MVRLFVLFVLLPVMAQAQCGGPSYWDQMSPEDRAELALMAADTPYPNGLIWQAHRGDTTLTIVGTMHLPDSRHAALVDRLRPALTDADLLLVEATADDQIEMQTYMAENPDLLAITDGPSLPDRLDADTWAAIADAARDRSIPGFLAAKMQPWFLSMTLAMPPCAVADMARGAVGLDGLLMQEAERLGLPIAPLEPWQDMFDLLTAGTFDEQLIALQMALVDPAAQNAMVVALTDLYFLEQTALSWHINSFTRDLLPDMDDATFDALLAELEQTLLIDRNARWIPVIDQAAARHDHIVVAFGAAHLIDDTGVLALLAKDGWTLTRQ